MKRTSANTFAQLVRWVEESCRHRPFLLGIGGPGGGGKSTLCQWLLAHVTGATSLPLDDFRLPRAARKNRGLFASHPEGNDLPRLHASLQAARKGEAFTRPIFDSKTGTNLKSESVSPGRVLVCDGEIAAHTGLRDQFDGLVIVEAHWRTQLNARLTRDLRSRNCSLEKAIRIFLESNLRDYPIHAVGASEAADFVLYRNRKNEFSIRKAPPETEPPP